MSDDLFIFFIILLENECYITIIKCTIVMLIFAVLFNLKFFIVNLSECMIKENFVCQTILVIIIIIVDR